MIDMASVYAERFKSNPDALRAAVMGQSPDPKLDPYTALNALRLVKESQQMAMAGQAQQPTSAPSILAQNLAPPTPPQGLAGMMPMGAPAGQMPQGMPQQRPPMPQQPMQAASGGLAGMPTSEEDYAEGGIVAFQSGGKTAGAERDYTQEVLDSIADDQRRKDYGTEQEYWPTATGDEVDAPDSVQGRATAEQKAYREFDPATMTPAEIRQERKDYLDFIQANSGPDIYTPARGELSARKAAMASDRNQGTGLALLTAAGAILKGRNLAEGASNALPAFAQQMGEVQKAEQQEKRAIAQMNFALDDAQRKERMGDARGAQAAVESARKFQQDANRAKGDKLRYSADIATRNVQYSRLANKGAGEKESKVPEQLAKAEIAYAQNPTKENLVIVQALRTTQDRLAQKQISSISDNPVGGPKATNAAAVIASKENTAAQNALNDFKTYKKTAWKKYVESHGGDETRASQAYKSGWKTTNPNAGSDDFDPASAADYTPTAKPAGTKPGAVLNYDASGKRIN
jgi:hypothetical protein